MVDEAGIVQRRSVPSGMIPDGRVALRSGVNAGAREEVRGVQKVAPGKPVTTASAKEADGK